MASGWRGGLRLAEFFLIEPDSFSFTDLVGDLEGELLVGEDGGGRSVVLSLSFESVLCFFFGEDLEKKVGRTMGDDDGWGIRHYPCIQAPKVRTFALKCFSAPTQSQPVLRRTKNDRLTTPFPEPSVA